MQKFHEWFSLVELAIIIVVLAILATIFLVQKSNFDAVQKDDRSKTAINAMYYSLENVFYAKNGYYPQIISSKILPTVETSLFEDSGGATINSPHSEYSYTPINCQNSKCRNYVLKARLINEADYVKASHRS